MTIMNCRNCKANCYWAGRDVTEPDHGHCFVGYIPKTNADRIRAMTDEELAEILSDGCCHGLCDCPDNFKGMGETPSDCKACWLDWLKQEVDT